MDTFIANSRLRLSTRCVPTTGPILYGTLCEALSLRLDVDIRKNMILNRIPYRIHDDIEMSIIQILLFG